MGLIFHKAGNPDYRQTEIAGANHFFRDLDDIPVSRINAWQSRFKKE